MTLLLVYVLVALGVSFLCSVLEAVLLSIRPYELQPRAEAGHRGAARLAGIVENRLDDAIAAILTLNTFSHTIGAGLAGAQAEKLFGSAYLGVFVVVLTLLVLVFSEIVPKTIGAAYAPRLVTPVGAVVSLLIVALGPLLRLTKGLTHALSRGDPRRLSKQDVRAMVTLARAEGALGPLEERMLLNLLRLGSVTVEHVMTPRTVVKMLPETAPLSVLLEDSEARGFTRIPLHRGNKDEVSGYVTKPQVLEALLNGTPPETPLREFRRPVRFVPETLALGPALEQFLEQRDHLALVVDEYGGVAGLLTLEDILETAIGAEIRDETDVVEDMRELAARHRDERLRKMGFFPPRSPPAKDGETSPGGAAPSPEGEHPL